MKLARFQKYEILAIWLSKQRNREQDEPIDSDVVFVMQKLREELGWENK